jgi:four helix bundle protein
MALPYRELVVWRRAYDLAIEVVELTESPSFGRRWYLRDQIARAALSIPANIAEGNGRSTPLDYAAFLDRARGSAYELDTWLLMSKDLRRIPADTHSRLEAEVQAISAMLLTMSRRLRSKATLESR